MNLDLHPFTDELVVGTLICILKSPPPAHVIDKDGFKVGIPAKLNAGSGRNPNGIPG
jgi:hypothetical protein